MKNTFLKLRFVCASLCFFISVQLGFAQLPQCQLIYADQFNLTTGSNQNIYTYDPALPISATNPVLNTIQLPPYTTPGGIGSTDGGLTVSPVLGSGSPTLTFYTVRNGKYWYYSPTTLTWVNTNHSSGSNGGVNIGAGHGYIYNLDGANGGDVFRYDGTGNSTHIVNVPEMGNEGPWDIIADCEGNFYLFNASGNVATPFLRRYDPNGVLQQSWTVNNPSGYTPSAGFGIFVTQIYTDNTGLTFPPLNLNLSGIVSGSINATTADLLTVAGPVVPFGTTFAAGDLGSCEGGVPILPTIIISASATNVLIGTPVTFTSTITGGGTNPAYQWFVNGVLRAGETNSSFTYEPANGDVVTCQLTSDLTCASVSNALSAGITITAESCDFPSLVYAASTYCKNTGIAIPSSFSPSGGSLTVSPGTGLIINNSNGDIDLNSSAPGSYIITYTKPATALCPPMSISDTILINPSPSSKITMVMDGGPLCQNDTMRVSTTNTPDYLYSWLPENAFPYGRKEAEVITKVTRGYIYLSTTNPEGCTSIDSMNVMAEDCCDILMPNAFSPNGDGVNEVFKIYANTAQDINQFSIYNRWGERIFYTNKQTMGWNGEHNNTPVDAGTYYYYISYYCSDGKEMVKRGEVLLLR